jgi:hypothetical protein
VNGEELAQSGMTGRATIACASVISHFLHGSQSQPGDGLDDGFFRDLEAVADQLGSTVIAAGGSAAVFHNNTGEWYNRVGCFSVIETQS